MKYKINAFVGLVMMLFSLFMVGCVGNEIFRDDLPDSNSKPDTALPQANFSYASTLEDFRTINFTNLSTEATLFEWNFGSDNISMEKDPTYTFEEGEGTYSVTLKAADALGVVSTVTIDVIVVEGPFQPIIIESGFEDDALPEGGGDGRDSWRNSDLGGVIQISSSPVSFGDQAAKLPNDESRIGYQEIAVEPETNYDLRFYYTMLSNATDPWVTVSILGITENGVPTSREEALAATIASVTVNDTEDPATYIQQTLAFSSGANNTVAIYFYNGPVEARLDDFTIDVGADGAVPPSAGFSSAQSETNFLEYSFSNESTGATSYLWDFGDGNTSTEESPTHVYDTHDTYTVTLTATNEANLSTSLSQGIDIQAPVSADFTFQVDPNDYKTYTFTDASVGAVMLLWEFGNGFQFTGMNPTHTYTEDGVYDVTLTAYSVTGAIDKSIQQITVAQGFIVQVLNGTLDDFTGIDNGDNVDAWDMTPNSTVKALDGSGETVPSPYRALWNNTDLNDYIDATYGSNEQPANTGDGNASRGAKFSSNDRRMYQLVTVEQGASYKFTIDTRSEAEDINTEVFILNEEITTEADIDASKSHSSIDAYYNITNDFNTSKSMFTTSSFDFTASSNKIVIYVRSLNAVDGSNEVFLDNVTLTAN